KPLFYNVPKSYEEAANDGERWRWMLARAVQIVPSLDSEVDMTLASFFRSQLGVQTMAYMAPSGTDKDGTFSLHTLKDTETIARLATGVQRFNLPDEF